MLAQTPPEYARKSSTEGALGPGGPWAAIHVLHVFQPRSGGVPTYVGALAGGLHEAGLRVSVACDRDTPVAEALRARGVEVLELDLHHAPHPGRDAAAVHALSRFCAQRGVTLLHGHSTKAGMLVALAGARAGVPSVYTPNGWSFEQQVPPALRAAYAAFERQLVRRYHTRVIAVSHSGRAAAARWRVAGPDEVSVIPTGLPELPRIARSRARARLGLAADEVVAVWVGRAAAQKRPRDLIPIARRLGRRVTVLALCSGAAGTELGGELAEAGVRLGAGDIDPALAYAAADMMIQTSAWEAAPLAVLEAMSAELPVIGYDVGGVAEQVRPGRTGYLVAPGDAAMLCECVLALARRPEARRAMGRLGAHRVREHFSHPAMVARFLAAYGELAGDGTPLTAPAGRPEQLGLTQSHAAVLA